MKYSILMLGTALAITIFTGCKKDEEITETPTTPTATYGEMEIEFEHTFDGAEFTMGTTYTNANGEEVNYSTVKYYVSNIKLTKTDGTEWVQPESYYLVDLSTPSSAMLHLHDVPTGDYTDITFTIGVDSTRCVSGAQEGALAISNNMFWSWNSGYIFVKMEGSSSASNSGQFAYHIGGFSYTNNAINTGSFAFAPSMLMIRQDAAPVLHMALDLNKVYDGPAGIVSVAASSNVTMPNANAVKISDNFFSGISFEHIHN